MRWEEGGDGAQQPWQQSVPGAGGAGAAPSIPHFRVSERWYPGQKWEQYSIVMLNLKRTPLVGGHDRCLLCPVVIGALCLQMLDNHLLIPWGLGAAVFSLPVLPPTRTPPRWGNIETRTSRTWVRF